MAEPTTVCSISDCEKPRHSRGWCSTHYERWRVHGDPHTTLRGGQGGCDVEGCARPFYGRGLCQLHWNRLRKTGTTDARQPVAQTPCAVGDCARPGFSKGWCKLHYHRWWKTGSTDDPLRKVGTISKHGYRIVSAPGHPNASGVQGRIAEHRLVMADVLGRPLLPGENVHHINGVKTDNRPENLELWVTSQPKGQRVEDVLAWAREVVARYG